MSIRCRHFGLSLVVISLLVLLLPPNEPAAQGLPFGVGIPGMESVKIVPTARIGYQQMNINFNFPHAPIPWAWYFHRGSLDFAAKGSRLLTASAAVAVECTPAFSFFVQGETSFPRNVNLQLSEAPYDLFFLSGGVNPPHLESGHRFRWWQWDVGAAYGISGDVAVVAGVKYDQMTLDITGPAVENIFDPGPENHGGDMRTKMWIPYVGLQLRNGFLRASLIYSPVTSTNMTFSLTEADDKGIPSAEEAKFTLKRNGHFVEGSMDYRLATIGGLWLDLWGKASYVRVRGNASQIWSGFDSDNPGGLFAGIYPSGVTDEATATLTRSSWAGGFGAALPF